MSMSKCGAGGRLRRDGRKERGWRRAIADQTRSGESIRAFCRTRGLPEASFYHWRRELRLRDREGGSKETPPVLAPPVLAPVVVIDGTIDA